MSRAVNRYPGVRVPVAQRVPGRATGTRTPGYLLTALLIYRPRIDERLSWPGWLTYSGWLTHISGHPSVTGRASAGLRKFAGQRPTLYRCATQPTVAVVRRLPVAGGEDNVDCLRGTP